MSAAGSHGGETHRIAERWFGLLWGVFGRIALAALTVYSRAS